MPKLVIFLLALSVCYSQEVRKDDFVDESALRTVFDRLNKFNVTLENRHNIIDFHKDVLAVFYIKPGDVTVDAGAYGGDYAEFYLQLIGPKGVVVAYEANPLIFHSLLEGRFYKIDNVILRERAISNSTGTKIPMIIFPHHLGELCCSVEQSIWQEIITVSKRPTTTVDVITEKLDDFFTSAALTSCSFMKVDTEAHEYCVFEGAARILEEYRPIVIFEYMFVPGYREPRTIKQLQDKRYRCFLLTTFEEVGPDHIHLDPTDLVAIPEEKLGSFYALCKLLNSNTR